MPELPEVEVVRRQLENHILGATIQHIQIARDDIVRNGLENLPWYFGSRVIDLQRFGKSVVLVLSNENESRCLVVELGMTGLLLFKRESVPSETHLHVIIQLLNCQQVALYYWNARRFGRLHLFKENELVEYRKRRFGVDPLIVFEREFMALIKNCRGRVKALLLNQHRIAGIGNIYANEILFRAGIHPNAYGNRLSKRRIQLLFHEMREVLAEAIEKGGSSIRDYLSPVGNRGQFQNVHRVYLKEGQPCQNCKTSIRRLVAERSSFFCPRCQKR